MLVSSTALMVGCWPDGVPEDAQQQRPVSTRHAVVKATGASARRKNKQQRSSDRERVPLLGNGDDDNRATAAGGTTFSVNADLDDDEGRGGGGGVGDVEGSVMREVLDLEASSRAAGADAAAREDAEAIAKAKRERGYGTVKLLQLARPHRAWL
jgi:hypothetical protein